MEVRIIIQLYFCLQMAARLLLYVVIIVQLWASFLPNASVHAAVDKIRINTTTQLYTGSTDGRVYLFHGLAIESSTPPWDIYNYSDEQIELMKTVRVIIHTVGFVDLV